MAERPIGIDLGTTMSVVASVGDDGRPITINDTDGSFLVPSAVFFGDEVLVGQDALSCAVDQPDCFAECFKREMGSPYFHRTIRELMIPPEVLSAFVLERLRRIAERKCGTVRDAVISVPAYFDEKRRKMTQDAGRLAGLNVIGIINEPIAAAVAHAYDDLLKLASNGAAAKPKTILVYDLGGGTFDVSVLRFDNRKFVTLATDGDVALGGRDFDEQLVNYLADRFLRKHGTDPRSSASDHQRLWQVAQETKHRLSVNPSANAVVRHANLVLGIEITRSQFEDLIAPLIERTFITCEDVLQSVGMTWRSIDQILLVGGSSRLPIVRRKLSELAGRVVDSAGRPEELVCAWRRLVRGHAILRR